MDVLIAHSQPLIQLGLQAALGSCEDLRLLSGCNLEIASFDVAVTDLDRGMRLMSGEQGRTRRVLVVTDDESEVRIRRAMEAGILGYLPVSSTPENVAQAVQRVGHGSVAIDPRALTRMIESLNGSQLTDREMEVLRLIALGRSNKAVANQLGMAVGTAKHHVKQLLAKLSARSRTEAASIARRRGLVPRDGSDDDRSVTSPHRLRPFTTLDAVRLSRRHSPLT
jgi:DNA-binding NarL/FixJ family response regulator